MPRPRDFQRGVVYKSEQWGLSAYYNDASLRMTHEECRLFGLEIMMSEHWTKFEGYMDIHIREAKGRARALYHPSRRSITLPMWARNKAVIIHEHTHGLIDAIYNISKVPSHGIEFCGHNLCLVKELLGESKEVRLRNAYHQRYVRYLEPEALIKKPLLLEAPSD